MRNDESSFISDYVDSTAEVTDYGTGEAYKDVERGRESIEIGIMEQDKRVQGEKQGTNQGGGNIPPPREVLSHSTVSEETKETDNLLVAALEYMISTQEDQWSAEITHTCQAEFPRVEHRDFSGGNGEPPSRGVPTHLVDDDMTSPANTPNSVLPAAKAPDTSLEDAIFMRHTEPFLPACVAKILELIQIGEDITVAEREEVSRLIAEFADCFALSLSKVNLIPRAVHKLKVPEDSTFRMKILQHLFNPDQKAFMEAKVNDMLKAGVICPMHPGEVKCVAPSVLAHKAHENTGLSSNELKHKANNKCIKYGLPAAFDLPLRPPPSEDKPTATSPKKWHLCQDFGEINKLMPIAPVPQGDIRAKQLRLSGHRYIHIFDFTAGFYGIAIHPESQPYITFYLEGHRHFGYE